LLSALSPTCLEPCSQVNQLAGLTQPCVEVWRGLCWPDCRQRHFTTLNTPIVHYQFTQPGSHTHTRRLELPSKRVCLPTPSPAPPHPKLGPLPHLSKELAVTPTAVPSCSYAQGVWLPCPAPPPSPYATATHSTQQQVRSHACKSFVEGPANTMTGCL
jgi:hypothetical protein